jgi:hypothetical protein
MKPVINIPKSKLLVINYIFEFIKSTPFHLLNNNNYNGIDHITGLLRLRPKKKILQQLHAVAALLIILTPQANLPERARSQPDNDMLLDPGVHRSVEPAAQAGPDSAGAEEAGAQARAVHGPDHEAAVLQAGPAQLQGQHQRQAGDPHPRDEPAPQIVNVYIMWFLGVLAWLAWLAELAFFTFLHPLKHLRGMLTQSSPRATRGPFMACCSPPPPISSFQGWAPGRFWGSAGRLIAPFCWC